LVSKITGAERKVLEGRGSEALNEGSEVVGDPELLKVLRRRSGRRGGGGGGGRGNGGELRRDGDGVGEGLDLVGLAEGGRFKDVGLLGGFSGEFFGFLGGFGDEIGDPRGGRRESLRLFRGLFGEGLGALPQVLHWSLGEERKKLKREKRREEKRREEKEEDEEEKRRLGEEDWRICLTWKRQRMVTGED